MSRKEQSRSVAGRDPASPVWRIDPAERTDPGPEVALEPLGAQHAVKMVAWMRDPEVVRGLGVRGTRDLESTSDWIARAQDDPSRHPFAITADGEHVGNVVLDQVDDHLATARLSIFVGDAGRRGAGVGRGGVELALRHAEERLGLHKVWLTVHMGNEPAIAVYRRCGFELEGVLRDEFLLDGERVDLGRMGVILGRRAP